jgi:hypothetical protein
MHRIVLSEDVVPLPGHLLRHGVGAGLIAARSGGTDRPTTPQGHRIMFIPAGGIRELIRRMSWSGLRRGFLSPMAMRPSMASRSRSLASGGLAA